LTGIHTDIDALKGLHGALVKYRHAQRDVTARGEDQLRATRAQEPKYPADPKSEWTIRDGDVGLVAVAWDAVAG
jgi:hypothetical protein